MNDEQKKEALALSHAGWSRGKIGRHLGVTKNTVHGFLTRLKPKKPTEPRSTDMDRTEEFVEPHKPRKIGTLIRSRAVMPAALAFAAGQIDRAELMRRIAA